MSNHDELWRRYMAALGMNQTEESSVWQRFTVFLFSNLILLSATLWNEARFARMVLPVFGLLLGYFWLAITMRGFTFQRYYFHYCKQLEEQLGDHDLMTKAVAMSEQGSAVEVNGIRIQIPALARPVLGRHAALTIVWMFISIYLGLAVYHILGLGPKA